VNKALKMNKNKENISSLDEYQTLSKFGVAGPEKRRSSPLENNNNSHNTSRNSRSKITTQDLDESHANHDDPRNKRNSSALSAFDKHGDEMLRTYESDIIKNIQSIRRKSLEGGSSHSPDNVFETSEMSIGSTRPHSHHRGKVVKESSRLPSQNSGELNDDGELLSPSKHQVSSILKRSSSGEDSSPLSGATPSPRRNKSKTSPMNASRQSNKSGGAAATPAKTQRKSSNTDNDEDNDDGMVVGSRPSGQKQPSAQLNRSSNSGGALNRSRASETPSQTAVPPPVVATRFDEDAPIVSKHISSNTTKSFERVTSTANVVSRTSAAHTRNANHQQQQQQSRHPDDDEDDDMFDDEYDEDENDEGNRMMRTNVFTKNQMATLRHDESSAHHHHTTQQNHQVVRESLGSVSEMSRSEATPRVTPRRSLRRQVKEKSGSEAEEEDDDKF
jgi:hypothetical protein